VFHNGWYSYKQWGIGLAAYATYYENGRAPAILAALEQEFSLPSCSVVQARRGWWRLGRGLLHQLLVLRVARVFARSPCGAKVWITSRCLPIFSGSVRWRACSRPTRGSWNSAPGGRRPSATVEEGYSRAKETRRFPPAGSRESFSRRSCSPGRTRQQRDDACVGLRRERLQGLPLARCHSQEGRFEGFPPFVSQPRPRISCLRAAHGTRTQPGFCFSAETASLRTSTWMPGTPDLQAQRADRRTAGSSIPSPQIMR